MKKILFLINTLNAGGAEKVLVDVVNSLDTQKYLVTVQTVLDGGENKRFLSPVIRYKTMIRTKNVCLRRMLSALYLKILGAGFIYRLFVKERYDYEIAFLEGQPTRIISKSTNRMAKKYAWIHTDLNAYPNSMLAYGSQDREEEAYRAFDKVICVSEDVKREFLRKYRINQNRVEVLYNIIDDTAIAERAREQVQLPVNAKPVFISVGRMVPQKGYDRLLRVHQRLIREGYRHSLVLIGDGEQRAALSAFVQANGLSDTVTFLGYQSNPYKYVSRSDLFICSSYAEGYSTVVSEAVLCDTPVLSTAVSGANEPQNCPRCSIVVDNNEDALYESLKDILEDPGKLMALHDDLEQRKATLRKDHLVAELERRLFL